jgi:hypothetical protein
MPQLLWHDFTARVAGLSPSQWCIVGAVTLLVSAIAAIGMATWRLIDAWRQLDERVNLLQGVFESSRVFSGRKAGELEETDRRLWARQDRLQARVEGWRDSVQGTERRDSHVTVIEFKTPE